MNIMESYRTFLASSFLSSQLLDNILLKDFTNLFFKIPEDKNREVSKGMNAKLN